MDPFAKTNESCFCFEPDSLIAIQAFLFFFLQEIDKQYTSSMKHAAFLFYSLQSNAKSNEYD